MVLRRHRKMGIYETRLNRTGNKKRLQVLIAKDMRKENHADVIVFEYLEMQGISGKKKQKLYLWRKRDIQKCARHQAHGRMRYPESVHESVGDWLMMVRGGNT